MTDDGPVRLPRLPAMPRLESERRAPEVLTPEEAWAALWGPFPAPDVGFPQPLAAGAPSEGAACEAGS